MIRAAKTSSAPTAMSRNALFGCHMFLHMLELKSSEDEKVQDDKRGAKERRDAKRAGGQRTRAKT